MNIRQTAIPRRVLSLALCAAMVLTLLPLPTPAEGICDHHPEHTADCGYKAAVEGQDCAHSHDSLCGYQEASPCFHSHDESCGYRDASACAHRHTEECGENGESCTHQHDEACGYQEANPCTHSHDESCGYREASPCKHEHDGSCGYVEAVTGSPCTYRCEICAQQASQQQNGQDLCTHGNESAACETCASEKKVTEVQALINALPETVTEETREAAQSALSAVEEAKAALTEAEQEKLDLTRYTALKALLAEPEAFDTGKVLTDWEWVDDFEIIDPKTGLAHLPFASAENIAYYDAVIEVLPAAITANEEELTLGDWLCEDYPMESGAYEGEYVFETTLPEGYVLADGTNVLRLTVVLGDPEGEQAGQLTITPTVPTTGTYTIDGASVTAYQLSSPAHLYWFAQEVNGGKNTINAVLTADIRVNSGVLNTDGSLNSAKTGSFEVWTPIGTESLPYIGSFDGKGHTISGLYVNATNTDYVGLFGYIGYYSAVTNISDLNVTVQNVTIRDSYFAGKNYVGAVCGHANANFGLVPNLIQCLNYGTVAGNVYVGGICGGSKSGNTTNCQNFGKVSGSNNIGGVCGQSGFGANGKLSGCYNYGAVTASGSQVGGICGYNWGAIENSSNTGSVHGDSKVGGVCGDSGHSSYTTSITGCNNEGTVTGSGSHVGGICGYSYSQITNCHNTASVTGSSTYVGGICGYSYSQITNCHNTARVAGNGTVNVSYIGGVCGENYAGTIESCYNTGAVQGYYRVGGVCGNSQSSATIKFCYNTGALQGDNWVGGVCGYNYNSTISDCYNSSTITSTGRAHGGICGTYSGGTSSLTNFYFDNKSGTIQYAFEDQKEPYGRYTTAQFASGEVAYLLNGSTNAGTWKQNLDTGTREETPNFTSAAVYQATIGECLPGYTNNSNGAKNHRIENHQCIFCGYRDQFPITVSGITAVDKAYDGGTSATLNCNSAVLTNTVTGETVTGVTVSATGTFDNADAGARNVTIRTLKLTGAEAGKYYLAESGQQTEATATIIPKNITVTITPNGGTYGSVITAATANLNDVVSGDNVPVTLTYTGTANDGTVYSGTTVPTKAGSYTVTAAISNNNYKLTGTTTAKFVIDKATVTTPTISSKAYTGQLLAADVPASDLYTEKKNEGGTEVNASGYPVELELKDDKNYQWDHGGGRTSFMITQAANNWTVVPAITGWTYGEQANAPTSGAKFGTAQVTYLKDGTVLNAVPANAGSYTAHFSVDRTPNYDGLTKDVPFIISPKPVTVSGITAENKPYDGNTTATLKYDKVVFDGILEGDSLTVTATGTFADANAAENKTVNISGLTLGGASEKNYVLATVGQQATATATITPKSLSGDDITVTATNPTYNGAQQSPTVAVTYGEITLEEGKDYTLSGNAGTGAGTYTLKVELKGNYSGSKDQGWEITKASITPVVSLGDTVYGDPLSPSVSGNSGNGEVTYTYYSDATCTDEVTPRNAGTYYVKAAVAETANYQSGTSEAVPFQITPRPVTVSGITAGDKTYDGNTTATLNYAGVTFTGKLDGDSLTVTATGTFADANAAENKTVNISGLTLGGASEKNYVLATVGQQATATAAITKANASVTKAPEDAKSLYSGLDVPLVTEGTAQGGTMMYRLGEDGSWTELLPQAAAHGEYTVYYYVKGDDNHEDTVQQSLKARIRPFEIAAQPQTENVNYGDSKTLAVILNPKAADVSGITYQWCLVTEEDGREIYTPLEGETGSTLTLTKPNAGTYVYGCVITCGDDYSVTSDKATVTVTAVQKPLPSTTDLPSDLWAEGGEMPLVDNSIHLKSPSSFLLTSYTYNGASTDVHQNYPTGMEIYSVGTDDRGQTTVAPVAELNHLLRYSGCSIRITGKPGIRIITSLTKEAKAALKKGELAGYTLEEYGTVAVWSSDLGNQPLTLKTEKARNKYAYKRGVSDPVFANVGDLTQYTNVLVWDSLEDQKYDEDIVMRPYIKLSNKAGETVVLYGGTVSRSIGYVAQQNANTFSKGTAGYKYVHEIIDKVNALHSSTETNTTGG